MTLKYLKWVCACMLSHLSHVQLFDTLWTVARQAPLSLGFSRQEYQSGGPITSWEIDGETVETVSDFIWGGSNITSDGDCSHEIKTHLLFGRKIMANLDSIFRSRDITLPTKVRLVKATVFQRSHMDVRVGLWRKAEHWRMDAFEVWCWRRLLRVPWTARRSN